MSQIHRRRIGDRYELVSELGRSASRTVWHGRDESTGADVAIKVLRPELTADRAALDELRSTLDAVAQLGHTGILAVSEVVELDDQVALVSGFVPGGSLRSLLARRGPLPLDRSVSVMARVCEALGATHAIGVVHGDLAPSQVRLEPDRSARAEALLADFGMAALINRAAAGGFLPSIPPGQYQAPEIAAGQPGTAAADVYAIGVLLYETLTGHRPYAEPRHDAPAVGDGSPAATPPIAGLPGALWHTILGCLAPDPDRRPSAEQLAALLIGFGSPARVPSPRPAIDTAAVAVPTPSAPPDDATVFMPVIRPDAPPPALTRNRSGRPVQPSESDQFDQSDDRRPALVTRNRLIMAAAGVTTLAAVVVVGFTTLQPSGHEPVTGAAVPVLAAPGLGSAVAGSPAASGTKSTQPSPNSSRSPKAVVPAHRTTASPALSAGNAGASPSPTLSAAASSGAPSPSAITNAGNGAVTGTSLRNKYSGSCLDTNGAFANGADEQLWTCAGTAGESWTLTSTGALTQDGGAYCLDDYGFGTAPGSKVALWSCNSGANQQWTFRTDGSIVGVYSGLCLDIAGPGNGAQIQLSTCNHRWSQQWSWQS